MPLLFVLIFLCIIDSVTVIVSRYKGRTATGHITKVLINPLFYTTLFCYFIYHNVDPQEYIILLCPMAFYTIGDILMNPNGKRLYFLLGQLAFAIGHLCMMHFWLRYGVNIAFFEKGILISLAMYIAFAVAVYKRSKRKRSLLYFLPFSLVLFGLIASSIGTYNGLLPTALRTFGALCITLSSGSIGINETFDYQIPDYVVTILYVVANALFVISASLSIMPSI